MSIRNALVDQDLLEYKYGRKRDELITNLLKSSLQYALEANRFNEEDYFVEDVTTVIADYEMLILKTVDELIQASFAVVKEFGDKYPAR
jgi:hypothetical protein